MSGVLTITGAAFWLLVYAVAIHALAIWVGFRVGKHGARRWLGKALSACDGDEEEQDRMAVRRLLDMRKRSVAEFLYAGPDFDEFADEYESQWCPRCYTGVER